MRHILTLVLILGLTVQGFAQLHAYELKKITNVTTGVDVDFGSARSGGLAPNFDAPLVDSANCSGDSVLIHYWLEDTLNPVMAGEARILVTHFYPYHVDTMYTLNHYIDTLIYMKARLLIGFEPDSMYSIKAYYTLAMDTTMHYTASLWPETLMSCHFEILCFGNEIKTDGGLAYWVVGIDTLGPSASMHVDSMIFLNEVPVGLFTRRYEYYINSAGYVTPTQWATTSTTPEHCDSLDGTAHVNVIEDVANPTYQWEIGGTTDSIYGLANGSYSVLVTDGGSCTMQLEAIVLDTCEITTTVLEASSEESLMYPNPAMVGQVVAVPTYGGAVVEVADEAGRIILSQMATGEMTQINSATLRAGTYLVMVRGDQHLSTKQLVIQ